MALRIRIGALIEKIRTFDNSFYAIGQKKMAVNPNQGEEGQKRTFWPNKGYKTRMGAKFASGSHSTC
jgi:hypothetical protein